MIIGIGSTMFSTLRTALDPDTITIEQAFAVVLGSLTLMGLAIFCPRIAAGLVSGAPQLSAGAAAGTTLGVGAAGAVVTSGYGVVADKLILWVVVLALLGAAVALPDFTSRTREP